MNRLTRYIVGAAVASLPIMASAAGPSPQPLKSQFFDWNVNLTLTPPSNFVSSPFLNDLSTGTIKTQFDSYPSTGIKAVKVVQPLNTAKTLFNQHAISYVFGDLETASAITDTKNLVNQVRSSTMSDKAFVGNFDLTPVKNDPTRRGPQPSYKDYGKTGVNMANTVLYPGSSMFRSPASGDSNAPNIRSAMFIMPIWRQSVVQESLPAGHVQIPWYNNFENTGNASMINGSYTLNGKSVQAYYTNDQLLSRGDTKAQVLHMRMRDVYSLNVFNAAIIYQGQESKTDAQRQADLQNDVRDGWFGGGEYDPVTHPKNVFNAPDSKAVTYAMTQNIFKTNSAGTGAGNDQKRWGDQDERMGAVWSGRYSMSLGKLDILVSDLSDQKRFVDFGKVNGIDTNIDFVVCANANHLLHFDLVTKYKNKKPYYEWDYTSSNKIFIDNGRAGVGVPEPSMAGVICMLAAIGLGRRRRTA